MAQEKEVIKMKRKIDKKEERSSLLSKTILVWLSLILIEYVVYSYLIRNRQDLSPIPIIQNIGARWVVYYASYIIYSITSIVLLLLYLIKRHKIK